MNLPGAIAVVLVLVLVTIANIKYVSSLSDLLGLTSLSSSSRSLNGDSAAEPLKGNALVRTAKAMGMQIPDVWRRGRELMENDCPPYVGGALQESDRFRNISLTDLENLKIALITVSYRTPKTLANSVKSWSESGLLDLVDEKIMWLNAAQPEEIALGERHGFRVMGTDNASVWKLVHKHLPAIHARMEYEPTWQERARTGQGVLEAGFPFTQVGEDGKTGIFVAPSLLLATHETDADLILFLEKDFILRPNITFTELVRSMLASLAAAAGDTPVVRLRDRDDPDRSGLPNCCTGECGTLFSNFDGCTCCWSSSMNWLKLWCMDPTENVESSTQGQVKQCYSDSGQQVHWQPPPDLGLPHGKNLTAPPINMYCFSTGHAGWSNNAALFRRHYFQALYSAGAALSNTNAGFEENMMHSG